MKTSDLREVFAIEAEGRRLGQETGAKEERARCRNLLTSYIARLDIRAEAQHHRHGPDGRYTAIIEIAADLRALRRKIEEGAES